MLDLADFKRQTEFYSRYSWYTTPLGLSAVPMYVCHQNNRDFNFTVAIVGYHQEGHPREPIKEAVVLSLHTLLAGYIGNTPKDLIGPILTRNPLEIPFIISRLYLENLQYPPENQHAFITIAATVYSLN